MLNSCALTYFNEVRRISCQRDGFLMNNYSCPIPTGEGCRVVTLIFFKFIFDGSFFRLTFAFDFGRG
jgi:hypothetical protein